MDQNNPNNSGFNSGNSGNESGSGFGTGSGSSGSTSYGSGSSGTASYGSGSGSMGGGSGAGNSGSVGGGFGVTSASETGSGTETCAHCGQSLNKGGGLEQLLGRLGINDDMINNLKGQFQNVDIDEYLNTAREYLKDSSGKAQSYAKDNPGKVAAGVAALALGAGLIYAAVNRDK